MRAVSDSGPLIHLSWIDQLDLLQRLFESVVVPPSVRDEVLAAPASTLGVAAIERAFSDGRLKVETLGRQPSPVERLSSVLGTGEIEALLLMEQTGADLFLSDDAAARSEAARHGLNVAGTVGMLIEARNQGLVSAALPLVLELRRLGQWMSEELVQRVRDEEEHLR